MLWHFKVRWSLSCTDIRAYSLQSASDYRFEQRNKIPWSALFSVARQWKLRHLLFRNACCYHDVAIHHISIRSFPSLSINRTGCNNRQLIVAVLINLISLQEGASWSSINHDGSWKLLHHVITRAYAPLIVSAWLDQASRPSRFGLCQLLVLPLQGLKCCNFASWHWILLFSPSMSSSCTFESVACISKAVT